MFDPEETDTEFEYTEEPDADEFSFSENGDDSDYGGYVDA